MFELTLIIYFLLGFLDDIIITSYYFYLHEKKIILSGLTSFLITTLNYLVFYYLLLSPEFIKNVISFGLGCGLGTSLIVWYKKKFKNKKLAKVI